MKKIVSGKAGQLCMLLLAAVLLSGLLTVTMDHAYSDWVPTTAVITDWKTAKEVKHILYFQYAVHGTTYVGQDVFSGNFPEEDIGDIVTVWYDPDDPMRVLRSDTKPDAGLWTYAPFFLLLPLSLFVLTGGSKRMGTSSILQ